MATNFALFGNLKTIRFPHYFLEDKVLENVKLYQLRIMKYLLYAISLMFLMAGCTQTGTDSTEASIAVVKNYLEAVDNNDYDLMESLLADDYLGLGPSLDDSTNKELALASWKWNTENLYEDVQYERTQTLATTIKDGSLAGEWAFNWTYVTIKYKDGSGPVSLMVNAVYKIEDGKIARSRTFYNEADVYRQLGYRVFPPLTVPESE